MSTIADFPAGAPLDGTEVVPMWQGGKQVAVPASKLPNAATPQQQLLLTQAQAARTGAETAQAASTQQATAAAASAAAAGNAVVGIASQLEASTVGQLVLTAGGTPVQVLADGNGQPILPDGRATVDAINDAAMATRWRDYRPDIARFYAERTLALGSKQPPLMRRRIVCKWNEDANTDWCREGTRVFTGRTGAPGNYTWSYIDFFSQGRGLTDGSAARHGEDGVRLVSRTGTFNPFTNAGTRGATLVIEQPTGSNGLTPPDGFVGGNNDWTLSRGNAVAPLAIPLASGKILVVHQRLTSPTGLFGAAGGFRDLVGRTSADSYASGTIIPIAQKANLYSALGKAAPSADAGLVYGCGAGAICQLASGRVLIGVYVAGQPGLLGTIYSDDDGATWSLGQFFNSVGLIPGVPTDVVFNEVSIAVCGDGKIRLYARNDRAAFGTPGVTATQYFDYRGRGVFASTTGVDGWAGESFQVQPGINGVASSAIRPFTSPAAGGSPSMVMIGGATDPQNRIGHTYALSFNDGKNFPVLAPIYEPGEFVGYDSLYYLDGWGWCSLHEVSPGNARSSGLGFNFHPSMREVWFNDSHLYGRAVLSGSF